MRQGGRPRPAESAPWSSGAGQYGMDEGLLVLVSLLRASRGQGQVTATRLR